MISSFLSTSLAQTINSTPQNLGFENWDAVNKKIPGWQFRNLAGFTVAQDCDAAIKPPEGKCALKISGAADAAPNTFQPMLQILPSSFAAGHQIKLSGWIRTENLMPGWAAIWMRVDANSKPNIAFDNMQARAPTGTTDWQRFELSLPVAPNTDRIFIGVLLSGIGTAWFDDLKVDVDKSVSVPMADIPTIKAPPRPIIPTTLLDDNALNLPGSLIPSVKDSWRDDVRKRHHAIRSLSSDDFSDLQFLKPLLKGKRVIQLGESSHGIAEFNWLKVRLVKFLHKELGYDVLAFESSLTGCDSAEQMIGRAADIQVMNECIFGVWRTEEVLPVFAYLDAARKLPKPLTLAGFDIQNSGSGSTRVAKQFMRLLETANPELAKGVAEHEVMLKPPVSNETATLLSTFYGKVEAQLVANRPALRKQFNERPNEVDLAIQEARSRILYARQLAAAQSPEGSAIRDKGMADNLDFLLDTMYPKRKVIVWAHNFHITYQADEKNAIKAMGAWMGQRRRPELYTIGLFMGRGIGAMNDRSLYEIQPPAKDTLEAIMANTGRRMSFVDFSTVKRQAGNEWIFESLDAREWGITRLKVTPHKMYDGIIYIDTVTPPKYR